MEKINIKTSKWNTPIWGSILTIIAGLILVFWPELAVSYIVILIGALFLISGLFVIITHLINKNQYDKSSSYLLFTGIGSVLLGLWLISMPEFFVNILMFVMGGLLVLAGIQQIGSLIIIRKSGTIPFVFYIIPALVLLAGILIIINPFTTATNVVILFGISAILYGIAGLLNWYKAKQQITF